MLAKIHELTTSYLIRSILPPLGSDEATYVEYGFARFLDSETKSTTIDEPLVLLALMEWMTKNHDPTFYNSLTKELRSHQKGSNGFENYIAFCLDLLFSGGGNTKYKIGEVFTFVSGKKPAWADMEAELVSIYRTSSGDLEQSPVKHFAFQGPSVTLGLNADSPEMTSSWLRCDSSTPMMFPHNSMGPDLVFVLKLEDGTNIWVALQAKYSACDTLKREYLRSAMRSVTPRYFWLEKVRQSF